VVRRRGLQLGTAVTLAAALGAGGIGTALLANAAPELEGSGTESEPFRIDDAADFAAFIADVNGDTTGTGAAAARYVLTSDVALTAPVPMIDSFAGTLDGAGHTVFGLTVDFSGSAAYTGTGGRDKTAALINQNSGTVERIGFADVLITGNASAESQDTNTKKAAVVANNHGLVDQVYVTGALDGGWRTGGIVADNLDRGVIQNSYFRGSIHSGWEAGGITARNDNVGTEKVTNVYADAVMATDVRNIGIIAGYSYSTATITGAVALGGSATQGSGQSASTVGRINGQDNTSVGGRGAHYANNLALSTITLGGATVTGAATNRQGQDATAAQLAQQSTYEDIGWDFEAVWAFDATAQRPVLAAVPEKDAPDEGEPGEPGADLSAEVDTTSPDGRTVATVFTDADGDLGYSVTQDGQTVVRESDLGLVVGGTDWGADVTLGTPTTSTVDDTYPLIGTHDTGHDHHNASIIPVERDGESDLSVEIRVFDTGIAVRYVLDPSLAGQVVQREDTTFAFDPASTLNYQVVTPSTIDDLQNSFSRNVFAAVGSRDITVLPTVEVPNGHYANITEAYVRDWPAIALKTSVTGSISTYYWATDNRLGTFTVKPETLRSPFRVVTIADDLTDLTSSDIVTAVNPPIDQSVFPGGDTSWIEPGTNSWSTQSTGDQTFEGIRGLIDAASEAHIPGVLIEGNLSGSSWGSTTAERFAKVKELADRGAAKEFPVKIWLWTDYDKGAGADTTFTGTVDYSSGSPYPQNSLQNPDFRAAYMDLVKASGIVGLKIDHTGDETETKVNFFGDAAKDAAARQLMVIFHNPLEPTGLNRTYPNELGREAIRGLQNGYSANQNTLAPFTRLVAGPADFTPFLLSGSGGGDVTWAHQLASTVVYSMPYLQLSERPAYLAPGGQLHDLVGDVIANMPTTWKRSWMLPQAKIGTLTAVVRETQDGEFWIAATGGSAAVGQLTVPLDFLPAGATYNVDLYTDKTVQAAMSRVTRTVDSTSVLTPTLRSGGGFLARITTDEIDNPLGDDGAGQTYQVATEDDLALIAQHPSGTFELTADIRLTKPWTPVSYFDGTIDGDGHKIVGLEVAGSESKAFITTNAGTIRRLGFVDATSVVPAPYVQSTRVAVVTVTNSGTIDQVFVSGSDVEGGWRTAPIAAENNAVISNSYTVDSTVVANWEAGGLVGWNSSTALLLDNYVVDADVRADVQNAGILTGYGYSGTTVTGNVVVSGTVQTTNNPRARILARENGVPTYTDNLSLDTSTVNGQVVTDGTATNRQGANRTAEQLAEQATYEAIGWDFAEVWTMDATGRPVLRAVPETVDLPEQDSADQQVTVTVPQPGTGGPGELVWGVDGTNGLVDLGTAEQAGDHFAATGSINPVRVTDTRGGQASWSLLAQVSDFTSGDRSFSGKYLGWSPRVVEAGGDAQAGDAVASGFGGGDGLSVSAILGHAAAGHEIGSAKLGADLDLRLPLDVVDGTYQATLTLTALG